MNDYGRISEAIRFLEGHASEQPSLSTLATHLGMSTSHCHRLFSRWAGVTPKDFVQALTVERAKAALRKGESVLEATYQSGLSGPGRLHDLCVSLEAASPGEIKSRGEGLTIDAALIDSPFGKCLLGECERGVCHLSFHDEADADVSEPDLFSELELRWERARIVRNPAKIRTLGKVIFSAEPEKRLSATRLRDGIRLFVRGSGFQVKVWRALLAVSSGSLVSYGSLAKAIEAEGASRAVGSAVGRNEIAYLIPCHRVVLSTGVIHAYRWGALRKKAILAQELTQHV